MRFRLKFTIFLTAPIGNLSTADWLSFYYDKASSERKTDSLGMFDFSPSPLSEKTDFFFCSGVPSDFHTVSEMTKFRHVDVRKYIGVCLPSDLSLLTGTVWFFYACGGLSFVSHPSS